MARRIDLERTLRSMLAGACGSVAHSGLMYLKYRAGLLPSFQPYDDLQRALAALVGGVVPSIALWALSFFNGAVVLGFVFGRAYRRLPGRSGFVKGVVFGTLGWIAVGTVFFPLLGLGPFGSHAELGWAPALFSLAMVLSYSVTMGVAYALILPKRDSV